MEDGTTYDVRVYRTEVYKGAKLTTHKVRWKTAHRLWTEGFRNAALADRTGPPRLPTRLTASGLC